MDVIDDAVVFLGTGDEVEMGDGLEEFLAAALGHAAEEAVDDLGLGVAEGTDLLHFAEGLLFGLVAD